MRKLLLGLFSVCFALGLYAQTYPTTHINGQEMYVYTVQKGEGLYRISKTFGVAQEDIIRNNPELEKRGLRVGQTIYIPIANRIDSTQYIVHEILPKETLYGLSRRYGVKIAEIQELNPEISKNMPIGARLLIPKTADAPAASPVVAQAAPATVPPAEEPTASATTAARVQVIQAPQTEAFVRSVFSDAQAIAADSAVVDTTNRPIRIAYLLPLMSHQAKRTPTTERFVEFYEGSLLALNEAQQQGKRFEIYVFDTEKNDIKIRQLLQQPEMQQMDAFIGPAYTSQISYVADFAAQHHIPTLIPFTSKVAAIEQNPYILQFNPSENSQMDSVVAFTQRTYPNANYIFVETGTDKVASSVSALRKRLQSQQASISTLQASALINDSLPTVLHAGRENILVFDTEKYASVAPLIAEAAQQQGNHSLTLFAHYGWADETIALRHFYASVFHSSRLFDLPFAMYELKFRHFFGHGLSSSMPRYDVLGYDLTLCLIGILEASPANHYKGLQSDIHFKKISEVGGAENTCIQIIQR